MADAGVRNPVQELHLRLMQTPANAWVQGVIQGAQKSLDTLFSSGPRGQSASSVAATTKERPKLELSFQERLENQLAAWRRNSAWVDEIPDLKGDGTHGRLQVTVPKGALCKFDSRFQLGIPPDAVYNILIDPNNKRVFKNIQEVKYRKVLEDEGMRQLVELEQLATWRFLWLSGTLSACVLVDQDRNTHTVLYRLLKSGFMKKFEGTWKIEPLFIDDLGAPVLVPQSGNERVASVVTLQQIWQPVIVPPPPFSNYVRGITTKTTVEMIQELQAEAERLRGGPHLSTDDDDNYNIQSNIIASQQTAVPLVDEWKQSKRSAPGRRKSRRSQWRIRSEA